MSRLSSSEISFMQHTKREIYPYFMCCHKKQLDQLLGFIARQNSQTTKFIRPKLVFPEKANHDNEIRHSKWKNPVHWVQIDRWPESVIHIFIIGRPKKSIRNETSDELEIWISMPSPILLKISDQYRQYVQNYKIRCFQWVRDSHFSRWSEIVSIMCVLWMMRFFNICCGVESN